MSNEIIHTPVLKKEVLQYLNPSQDENFIDCTIGEGGHTRLILEMNKPKGKVLGIDLDPAQIETGKWMMADHKDRLILENNSYVNLEEIVERKTFEPVSGILLDVGMSSVHLDRSQRGFSFQLDQNLDMRYNDERNTLTAEKIVNDWPEEKIGKIIDEYGEEKFSRKIAQKIVEERKKGRIKSTFQLVKIIKDVIPARFQNKKIHCATRTFQALRIAVNGELENLEKVLPVAFSILAPGGRLVVISFHSLEDRIVKNFFNQKSKDGLAKILTKKPVTAESAEIGKNPRSRSAKLRAILKI
jgi:16S rRNA (cytosine1402-N4)-methyltransferase